MGNQSLMVLLIEDNPIYSGIGDIVLANANISSADVAETSPKAMGFMRQRVYSLIIVNEIADLLPNQGEYPLKNGWIQHLIESLKREKESTKCLIMGLYKNEQSRDLWKGLTNHVFHQFDFYERDALQQVLDAEPKK